MYFLGVHKRLGDYVYQKNSSDGRDIPRYTTRKGCITILYHAIEDTVASKASIIKLKRQLKETSGNLKARWESLV